MIKLVAMDMDGTLLSSSKELSEVNRKTIEAYSAKGIAFAFCTGRVMNELEDVARKMPYVKYAITCNGALVYDISDLKKCRLIHGDVLKMEDVRKIFHRLRKGGFPMMFELQADGVIYSPKEGVDHPDKYGVGYIRDFIKKTRIPVDIEDYINSRTKSVGKINVFFPNSEIRLNALDYLKDMKFELAYSEPTNLDINQAHANKGRGLGKLMEYLHIAKEETMAIGDNVNDITLLKATPNSVVMENAPEEIKKYGSFITLSNDDNGVAYAIKKFC